MVLALNTTRFLRKERAYLPWESAVRNLEYFLLMFDRSEVYGPMQVRANKTLLLSIIKCYIALLNGVVF